MGFNENEADQNAGNRKEVNIQILRIRLKKTLIPYFHKEIKLFTEFGVLAKGFIWFS